MRILFGGTRYYSLHDAIAAIHAKHLRLLGWEVITPKHWITGR